MNYQEFLAAKIAAAKRYGFDVDQSAVNPALKNHTQAMVRWAVAGGRRALFSRFGLHKTAAQLEIMRLIGQHKPCIQTIKPLVRRPTETKPCFAPRR